MTDFFLFGSAFGLAAFLAAIVVVLCVAIALHWGHGREQGFIPYIFYPAILVIALRVLFSGRNLNLEIDYQGAQHSSVIWASRFTSLFLLFAVVTQIGKRFLHYGPKPDVPAMLIVAFWVFVLTNVVTSAIFGAHPSFSHDYIYTALAGYAALLVSWQEGDTAIRSARNALFIFLVLSALCIVWRPEMVLIRSYRGLLPGLSMRYFGLTTHPNTLGPVVVVFLLCLWSRPYSARSVNLIGWTIGCASLVLTQSKTNWIALLLCVACLGYFRHRDFLRQQLLDLRRPLLPAALLALAMLAICALGVALMFFDVGDRLLAFFETREGADLLSMTGRSRVWTIAVEEWSNNPLFGYGLTIWNRDYRAHVMMPAAVDAHNQFYQSLSSAGIVGAAGLAIYAAALFWFVLKTTKASQGLTAALFMLVLILSISEVPLSLSSGYGPSQLTHLLLLMAIASQITPSSIESRGAKAPAISSFRPGSFAGNG